MDVNVPEHITTQTLVRARKLFINATQMNMPPGRIRWNESGNTVYFMLRKQHDEQQDLCIIYCTPMCYLVEHMTDDEGNTEESYMMIRNIRNFLFKLRKLGFTNCEDVDDKDFDISSD